MRWYNLKSCFRGLMDKALASEASHVGSSPTGNIFVANLLVETPEFWRNRMNNRFQHDWSIEKTPRFSRRQPSVIPPVNHVECYYYLQI